MPALATPAEDVIFFTAKDMTHGIVGRAVEWCAVNSGWLLRSPMDPYPFQFFNLALAILVGLQGPLIVMSQNRQSLKDRARADTDFKVNLKNEVNIETLLRELSEFRAEARVRAVAGEDALREAQRGAPPTLSG